MSTFDRQAVIETLSRLVTPGIKLTALADELGVRKHEYTELRGILFDLVEDGTVHVLSGGAFALAPTGRPSDPHGKPLPDVKPVAEKPEKRKEKTKPPVQQKRAALPWGKQAQGAPKLMRAQVAREQGSRATKQPSEHYDPETGETTPVVASPAGDDKRIMGRITVHPAGYGFVLTDIGETVFVPAKYRGT